jgi:hypothetical protein
MRTYCTVSGEIESLILDFSEAQQHATILSGPESQSASFSVAGGTSLVGEWVACAFNSV